MLILGGLLIYLSFVGVILVIGFSEPSPMDIIEEGDKKSFVYIIIGLVLLCAIFWPIVGLILGIYASISHIRYLRRRKAYQRAGM